LLASCASAPYEPVLSRQPASKTKYRQDLAYCREWAKPTDKETGSSLCNATLMPFWYVGCLQSATASKDARDEDKERQLPIGYEGTAHPWVNLCLTRKGYHIDRAADPVPNSTYPGDNQ